jgi:hypothetical protein
MLRALSRTLPVLQWAYRLALVAAAALAWNAYSGTGSRTGTGGSYVEDIQQALAALNEIARALQ